MDNFSADEIALFDQGHALYLDVWHQLIEFTRAHANTVNDKSYIFTQLSRLLYAMIQNKHDKYRMHTCSDVALMNSEMQTQYGVDADDHLYILDCEMIALTLAAGIVETITTPKPMPNPFNTECA